VIFSLPFLFFFEEEAAERRKIEKFENRHEVTCRAEKTGSPAPRVLDKTGEASHLLSKKLSLVWKVTRATTQRKRKIYISRIEIQGKEESEANKETQLAWYQHQHQRHHVAVQFFTSLLLFIYVIVSVFLFFSEKMQSIFVDVFVFVINRSSSRS
jgi:ATP-dependent Zn protease